MKTLSSRRRSSSDTVEVDKKLTLLCSVEIFRVLYLPYRLEITDASENGIRPSYPGRNLY